MHGQKNIKRVQVLHCSEAQVPLYFVKYRYNIKKVFKIKVTATELMKIYILSLY